VLLLLAATSFQFCFCICSVTVSFLRCNRLQRYGVSIAVSSANININNTKYMDNVAVDIKHSYSVH